MDKLLLLLFVFLYSCASSQKENALGLNTGNNSTLIGTWVLLDDSLSHIHFSVTEYWDYYEGEEVIVGKYRLNKSSCNDEGDKKALYLRIDTDFNNSCYEVLDLSIQSLVLIHVGSGNVIHYGKDDTFNFFK